MLWFRFLLCSVMWLSFASPALAHTVVLLRPSNHSAATTELLERLRGELLSVGFEVLVRDRPEPDQPWHQMLANEGQCDAVVDVIGDATPTAVDVWIVDRLHDFRWLARVQGESNKESSSKGVAIRASEVLRARLFESHVGKRESHPSSPVPSTDAHTVQVELRSEQNSARRLGFELGAVALASLDGVGPALLPLVRFDWAIEPKLVLQATLAGFGTRPSVATEAGNAQVAMQYGLLGACYRLDWQHPVRPLAALSLGALRTAVVGQAELPREGHSVDQWSFLFDASLGAAFQLSSQYALVLAGHAQLAQPYLAIHFGDQKVASSGRPNLLVSLTFGAWP